VIRGGLASAYETPRLAELELLKRLVASEQSPAAGGQVSVQNLVTLWSVHIGESCLDDPQPLAEDSTT